MSNKKEKIDEFLNKLSDYVNCVVQDATADCSDSYTGMGSSQAQCDMEYALYELFDIKRNEPEEEPDEDEDED